MSFTQLIDFQAVMVAVVGIGVRKYLIAPLTLLFWQQWSHHMGLDLTCSFGRQEQYSERGLEGFGVYELRSTEGPLVVVDNSAMHFH